MAMMSFTGLGLGDAYDSPACMNGWSQQLDGSCVCNDVIASDGSCQPAPMGATSVLATSASATSLLSGMSTTTLLVLGALAWFVLGRHQ
jgi:hypothetical protein